MYHALFNSEVILAKCSLTAESKNYNYHTPTHSLLFQGCKDSPRAIITINRKALKRSVHGNFGVCFGIGVIGCELKMIIFCLSKTETDAYKEIIKPLV